MIAENPGQGRGWRDIRHVVIGGARVAVASRQDLVEAMISDCREARAGRTSRARIVFDANGHGLALRETDPAYRDAMDRGDIIHADGGFLVAASRLLTDAAIPERSATTDMIHDAARRAEAEGLSFYLLGGPEQVNARCAEVLRARYPRLRIAGRHHGFFEDADEAQIVEAINASGADIVWVGLGKPKEQLFCTRHATDLKTGWLVTCGGCFNYITGDYSRAPLWMQRSGLEWVHRMVTRPRSLFVRYAVTTPHALWLTATKTPRRTANL